MRAHKGRASDIRRSISSVPRRPTCNEQNKEGENNGNKDQEHDANDLNDAADHYNQLRDNAEGVLDYKVKMIGTNTSAEEIRNLEIADRETEDIRITFNQVVKDLKLGQKI